MSRTCKTNTPLTRLIKQLTLLKEDYIVNDEFPEELSDKIQLLRLNTNISDEDFKTALKAASLDLLLFQGNQKEKVPQLAIQSLNYENYRKIYQNANTALGHMKHFLKSGIFRYGFIDTTNYGNQTDSRGRLLNDSVLRIPLTFLDFNAGLIKFKNNLVNVITEGLDIELDKPIFNLKKGANSDAYNALMNNPKVVLFLQRVSPKLDIVSSSDLDIHSALVILNNFDKLITGELGKVISISPENVGNLSNTNYISEQEGTYISTWMSDSLESYDANLYATNIGKFILGTILKVNSQGNPIPGRYMSSGDAFLVADVLNTAEMQYHALMSSDDSYDSNLSFKYNTPKALKTLLYSDNLPVIRKYKKEILPIRQFLYENNKDNFSIEYVTLNVLKSGKVSNISQVMNIENILSFELSKNFAPGYTEYTTVGKTGNHTATEYVGRVIALGRTYKTNSHITEGLYAGIFNQLLLDYTTRNSILKGEKTKLYYGTQSANALLTENPEWKSLIKALFNFDIDLDFIQELGSNVEVSAQNLTDLLIRIGDLFRIALNEGNIDSLISKFIELFNENAINKTGAYSKFYSNLILTISDRTSEIPSTVFEDSLRAKIPIYRLKSIIAEDSYYITNFNRNNPQRKSLNFLVGNPHILTSVNNPTSSVGSRIIENFNYPGPTAIRLETILNEGSNSAKRASGKEVFSNSVLGDFISLGLNNHTIGVQLMTYSDKSSGFLKMPNLDAIIESYGNKTVNKSIWLMSNDEIEDLFYYYRKNQLVNRVYNILKTWQLVLGGLDLPSDFDIAVELNNANDINPELFNRLQSAWKQVNDTLKEVKKFKKWIETQTRSIKETNPDFEMVKDLHFSIYSSVGQLNKNIYYHFSQIKSKQDFSLLQQSYTDTLFNDSWMLAVNTYLRSNGTARLLITKMSSVYGFDLGVIFPKELLHRRTLLDNFFRTLFNDLHFKGCHLDAVKKVPNYDEFIDIEESLKEEKKRFEAAGKRTVALPGTKESFTQNLLNGVPIEINVATINEPTEKTFTPTGSETDLEILNGSARISPIYGYMETASLPGKNFSGVNRKTIGMDVADLRATLFKYAEYVMNNFLIRNSQRSKYDLSRLFDKMHNIPFNQNIDITKWYIDPNSHITPKMANDGKDVYLSAGINHFKLIDIIYRGNNEYDLNVKVVDEHGDEYEDLTLPSFIETHVLINSLSDLFNIIGGAESKELVDGVLVDSDTSAKMLYNYVVNVGSIIDSSKPITKENVNQPLYDKFIAMAASTSGIKRSEVNTNNEIVYQNETPLLTFKARTANFGELMDASHDIEEDSNTTEPTQTMAALATNGVTMREAQEVYNSIANIIKANMQDIDLPSGSLEFIIQKMSVDIGKELSRGDDLTASEAIYNVILEELGGIIPISDPNFFGQLFKSSILELNRLALKRKWSGLNGVLNPSSNSIQMFNIIGVNGQKMLYDDLIRNARKELVDVPGIENLTTRQIVNLYLFTQSDTGAEKDITSATPDLALNIANAIEYNQYITSEEQAESVGLSLELLANLVGKKVQKGEVEPLDTVFYRKNGKWFKESMDSLQEYLQFLNDNTIDLVMLDISTPTDLKPSRVVFEDMNSNKSNLYMTEAASLMNIVMNELDEIDVKAVIEATEEGTDIQNSCKL